jgi:uncharacterized iron-regulated membrane protein
MRSDLLRVYKTVHTWTGIVCGLALFICFYAGAITMFKDQLIDWVTPPATDAQHVTLDQAPALIDQVIATYPEARQTLTLRFTDRDHAWLSWQSRSKARGQSGGQASGPTQRSTASFDAAGHLRIDASHPSDAPAFIDVLHMTAGLPGGFNVGMSVMGVVSLLYGLALVSGVIVLLPSLVKDLFVVRVGKNLKRMWLDAHNVVGILSLPFHLVMALSVVGFGLHDMIYDVQDKAFYGNTLQPALVAQNPFFGKAPVIAGVNNATPSNAALLTPAQLLANVREHAPGFEPDTMTWRRLGEPGATVFIGGSDSHVLARSGGFALMNPVTGAFVNRRFLPGAGNGNAWSATGSAIYALHFGSYGGAPIQWGYFLLGLAGAFLFYSGNLLWIESRRKSARAQKHDAQGAQASVVQRRSADLLASLTVGVSLGCIAGISATLAAGKLLNGHVADMHGWHASIYNTLFIASIGWAFLRGAPRAAVELLLLAVLTTAAIPLASLTGWLLPSTGLWPGAASNGSLAVDIVAALGACCLVWLARATARRVSAGRADSVWFDHKRQKSAVTESRNVRGLP